MSIQTRSANIHRLYCDGPGPHRFQSYLPAICDDQGWWLNEGDMLLRAVAEGWRETDRGWLCPKCHEAKP